MESSENQTMATEPQVVKAEIQTQVVDQSATLILSDKDRKLRMAAFVFSIISTVVAGVFILPLTWCIPMTVHLWGIYKGKKQNSVAFGICELFFCSFIGGILLLVSTKEK